MVPSYGVFLAGWNRGIPRVELFQMKPEAVSKMRELFSQFLAFLIFWLIIWTFVGMLFLAALYLSFLIYPL